MATANIEPERIRHLNNKDARNGDYVLYWMQQSQRAEFNHALEYAIGRANEIDQRLLVAFGLMDDYPDANARHYRFLLEGLQDAIETLKKRGIKMVVQFGHPQKVAAKLGESASIVVCDRGYLRHQKAWREYVAKHCDCEVVQIESDVVVPVDTTSNKQEFAARTIRPKVNKQRDRFLVELKEISPRKNSLGLSVDGVDLKNLDRVLDEMKIDKSVGPVHHLYQGGARRANEILGNFLEKHFSDYADHRNHPETNDVSYMSMYLHYGQMSPVKLALAVRNTKEKGGTNKDSFLEELIVRRELAQNFCNFTPDYDKFSCLPDWAHKTLQEHRQDKREHLYSVDDLIAAQTHDPYWNAAMKEMRDTGYMHNYMRMYWGKKILEWSATPEEAYNNALHLNNKYFLDGRDPNSYANVGWIFGLHDRAFVERKIFGKVRYMAAGGLERKCDIQGYVEKVEATTKQ